MGRTFANENVDIRAGPSKRTMAIQIISITRATTKGDGTVHYAQLVRDAHTGPA